MQRAFFSAIFVVTMSWFFSCEFSLSFLVCLLVFWRAILSGYYTTIKIDLRFLDRGFGDSSNATISFDLSWFRVLIRESRFNGKVYLRR